MSEVEELGKCLLSSLTFHSTNPLTTGCLAIHPCSSSAPFTEVRPNLQQRRRIQALELLHKGLSA